MINHFDEMMMNNVSANIGYPNSRRRRRDARVRPPRLREGPRARAGRLVRLRLGELRLLLLLHGPAERYLCEWGGMVRKCLFFGATLSENVGKI